MLELVFETARGLVRRMRAGEVSVREVVEAHLAQIERVNPRVNAVVTLCAESALDEADAADRARAAGRDLGPLFGLPVAHKDLVETKGLRTTYGSPLMRDYVPDFDALIVERIKAAGAITLGKTNTPEFGAGSQTYNDVFGETLNPWDVSRTCGGSSGGAAVALACGMVPIADGSDMGGSLRNPASFCSVVGFRPSPGRVPAYPARAAWSPFSVQGPMARNVGDAALLLSAIAGPDTRSPIAIPESGERFGAPLEREFGGVRVAWSRDLGGLPVDPRVTDAIDAQRGTFEALGCTLADAEPDFADADEIFKAWRAWSFELGFGDTLDASRDQLKDTVIWNIEQGRKLSGPELGRLERRRTDLYHRVREFMQEHEFLVLPVSQVPPFPVSERWVRQIGGVEMQTYIDWMKSCYFITVTGLPAISVPCGFTPEGLPVGVQIVGRHQDDLGVLQLAHAFEAVAGCAGRRPPVCESG
ncbi:MAG: amidase [Deltaproteobacteria bacterium]|nr:amidase [Deltaproteobacteria bacterium]MBW2414296.1 amidase [Deltaproteobacteria bacterium]